MDELLDEYRHLVLELHEATGDTTYWSTMKKQVEEITLFYNIVRFYIQKAHTKEEQAKKPPAKPTKIKGISVSELAKNAAIFKPRTLLHNGTINEFRQWQKCFQAY